MIGHCAQAISPDGERRFVARWDGAVRLHDRAGAELWRLTMKHPVASMCALAGPNMFVVGTWGGMVAGFDDRGLNWQHEVRGVAACVATSSEGTLVIGTWSGDVWVGRRERDSLAELALGEAVVTTAIDPAGATVCVALADHTLVTLQQNGSERWRRRMSAAIRRIIVGAFKILVITEDGALVWLNGDGQEAQRHTAHGRMIHLAVSRDGGTIAWTDELHRLHLIQPTRKRVWEQSLTGSVAAIAIVGHGDEPFCLVAQDGGRLTLFDCGQRCYQQIVELPGSIRELCASASGIEIGIAVTEGEPRFLDLDVVRDRLRPAEPSLQLSAHAFCVGQVGRASLTITNQGQRDAREFEVKVAGDNLQRSVRQAIGILSPGATRQVHVALEPTKAGELTVDISLRWCDERGNVGTRELQEFISVARKGSEP